VVPRPPQRAHHRLRSARVWGPVRRHADARWGEDGAGGLQQV